MSKKSGNENYTRTSRTTKSNSIKILIQAFLITYAFTVSFAKPLNSADFAEKIDYLLAEVAGFLGEYSLLSVLIFIAVCGLFKWISFKEQTSTINIHRAGYMLPVFFGLCLFLGRSYEETNSWTYLFGGVFNFIKFVIALSGMAIFLHYALGALIELYEKVADSTYTSKFTNYLFGKNCFLKVFLLLLLVWLPVIILSYPGNLCYDVIGQIEQGIGIREYSGHHPMLHTLLVGGLVNLGEIVFGSYEIGLFIYILVQVISLGSALAGTIWWLNKTKFEKGSVSHGILLIILGVYVFSPMYSNMVSTAIKDIPFMAAVIWYVILLAECYKNREELCKPLFVVLFIVVQVLVSLLRNNGFYMVALGGIIFTLCWWKEADMRGRIRVFLYLFLIPVIISKLLGGFLLTAFDAEEGGKAEMLSLPFQQTAGYLQLYRDELTDDEKTAIENVLGDVNDVAASYDPDIADPVKKKYYDHEDATGKATTGAELVDYLIVWAKCFFKHPDVYLEGFFTHVYGWFDPEVSNAPRYETDYSIIPRRGLFTGAEKVLIFIYRFAERITPLALLENVGAYTWALLLLFSYMRQENKKQLVLLVPLLISLLICMVSPCFYLHPRYAYPYMFTVPFLYGLAERDRK